MPASTPAPWSFRYSRRGAAVRSAVADIDFLIEHETRQETIDRLCMVRFKLMRIWSAEEREMPSVPKRSTSAVPSDVRAA